MSQYTNTYQLGATLVPIAVGTPVQVIAQRGVNGWILKKASGATLAVVAGTGFSAPQGYILGDSEVINIQGPATFFLAAGGATAVASLIASYSSGYSLIP
jgi:hypothetical protein